ncbi:MAG: histidine kinase [Paenibacillus sp.]|nr:histidine kinase [Paenibacillus sp.]
MDVRDASEQDIFNEELRVLSAAKAHMKRGQPLDMKEYAKLTEQYEKLLRMTIKLSRISDIQSKTMKDQEQAITAAHTELQHHEQLRRQLISDISHELRNPITSVQGYVKAFIDGIIEPNGEYLSMIYQKLLTINQLVTDLFQLSTLKANQNALHLQPVSVTEWYASIHGKSELEAIRQSVQLVYNPSVAVDSSFRSDPESAVFWIDSLRMDQVITNLLDNALKHTPSGGYVKITGKLSTPQSPASSFDADTAAPEPHTFTITVEDSGEGIGESELPFIFERFYRAKTVRASSLSGSGLGLAISKEIVLQHKGVIEADSELGVGSRFYVTLPVYSDHETLINRPRQGQEA